MPLKAPDMTDDQQKIRSVSEIVDSIASVAEAETVQMRDVVAALGRASFTPVMMAPAMAVVTPLSGIPLFSSICGLTIALVAGQRLAKRRHLWLPDWLMRRQVSGARLKTATKWMRKPGAFLDRHTRERLRFLVHAPFSWVSQLTCMLCGLAMPFLELVPFTSSILGGAVTLFSLSMLVQDGLVTALAFAAVLCAMGAGWALIT